jgi:alkylation response protein AidB-like acyl-CoA dehydrogenase
MDFTFTDDQLLFRDTIHNHLLLEATPELLRSIWETDSGRSDEAFRQFGELGLLALSITEDEGGLGCGDLDWVLMAEQVGYFGVPDSVLVTGCLGVAILNALHPDHPVRQAWIGRIAAGEARLAVGHPMDPLVPEASVASLLLLHHEGEVHAVPRDQVQLVANPSLDPMRRLSRVVWTPSDQTRVLDAVAGRAVWAQTLERGALMTAAQLVGLASRMMDLGVDYSANRKQFGKPIGCFQAVKHRMADIAVAVEFARPVLYRAAYALAHRLAQAPTFVSHARIAACEAAALAARNSIQVHGAMGYTWEVDLQIFMKRAWAIDAAFGDRGFHKQRIAAMLFADGAALGPGATFAPTV